MIGLELRSRTKLLMAIYDHHGSNQLSKYKDLADEFWAGKEPQLVSELIQIMEGNSAGQLAEITHRYAQRIESPEVRCVDEEIEAFTKLLKSYGSHRLLGDFMDQKRKTKNLTMIALPALAATDGMGDINEHSKTEWLYGIGLLLPFSCDVADDVVDRDLKTHDKIPYAEWTTVYKVASVAIYDIGRSHAKNVKTGNEEIDQEIQRRLEEGITSVSKSNRFDLELQKSKDVTMDQLRMAYYGKVAGIEETIFITMPTLRQDVARIFGDGSRELAVEYQFADDFEDLNGKPKENESPRISNPSYFLTFARQLVRSGSSFEDAMKNAAQKSFEIANEHHAELVARHRELPDDFITKPCFNALIFGLNLSLKDSYEKFMKGKTIPILVPQLKELL